MKDLDTDASKLVLKTIERYVSCSLEEVVKLVVDLFLEAFVGIQAIGIGLVVDDRKVSDMRCLSAQIRNDSKRYSG